LGTVPIFYLGVYSYLRGGDRSLGDEWPRLSLVALIVTGALVGIQGAATLSISLGVKDEFGGQPAIAGALFDIYNAVGAAIAVSFALFLVATGVAFARTRAVPTWWSQLLYVAGVASLISFLAPFTEIDALAFVGLLAFVLFIVWVAAATMWLMKPVVGAGTSTTAPPPR
ncbi:MAG: hypothetical protein M3238_02705, partial [Actinomycetota bacterium]|nr:hypothetical protein [Actinomycetota bacterium]